MLSSHENGFGFQVVMNQSLRFQPPPQYNGGEQKSVHGAQSFENYI